MIRLSVIVPTYNRSAVLARCLEALAGQDCGLDRFEVIVSDDGSTDDTRAVVSRVTSSGARPRVRYLYQSNAGANAARNAALAVAEAGVVLLINDDTIAAPGMIGEHLAAHAMYPDDRVAVLGRVTVSPNIAVSRLAPLHLDRAFVALGDGREFDWRAFFTCNVSVKKSLLERGGQFEVRLRYHEDLELAERLSHHGLRVLYRPEALGYHEHVLTEDEFLRIAEREARALVIWSTLAPRLVPVLASLGFEPALPGLRRLKHRLAGIAVNPWTQRFWRSVARHAPSRVSLTVYDQIYQCAKRSHLRRELRRLQPPDDIRGSQHGSWSASGQMPEVRHDSPPPAVSVIMNIHNGAAHLREAIDSVRAQTSVDWELICWDDGSVDKSAVIVREYQDPRIRLFEAGASPTLAASRQAAIKQARGEWLAFLDQDDVWVPAKLERQLQLATPDVGLIYGRALRFGKIRRFRDFDHRHEFQPLPEGDIFLSLFNESCYIAMSSVLIRRSAAIAGGDIPEAIGIIPDYFLFTEVARRARARAVQQVVCYYREHPDSLTGRGYHQMHLEALWLVDRWASDLPPRVVARRRAIHHTLVALSELTTARMPFRGLRRLATRGSLLFLMTRPVARSARAIKRRIVRPYWQLSGRGATAEPRRPRANVLGTPVTVSTMDSTVRALEDLVARRAGAYVSPANAYSVMLARDSPACRRLLDEAEEVTADGMSIVWALRRLGHAPGRVHNDDLFLEVCRRHPEWRHFLVGGRAGQPGRVAEELRKRSPGIQIVGAEPTPVRPVPAVERDRIINAIRETDASIVWVGMGTPAQDEWMAASALRANVTMVGVGSSFDLLAGFTRPAPAWMQRNGLQWLFRLALEPRRLLGRYLYYNTRFLLACARELRRRPRLRPATSVESGPKTGGARPEVSVVIVSHNVAQLLAGCLTSVFRECDGMNIEVLVVDSASTDDTVDVVRDRFPHVHVVACGRNVGFSAGNNMALRRCRGSHVVLLNPDTVIREGGLRRLIQHLHAYPEAGAVGPKLLLGNGQIQPECARNAPRFSNLVPWLFLLDKLEWRLRFGSAPRETTSHPPRGTWLDRFSLLSWTRNTTCAVDAISGACLVIRREVLLEVGLLDEAAPMYLDDIDYCRRIRSAGWEIHYVADAVVTHLWQQSTNQLSRAGDFYAMGCHSIWLYLRKHDGPVSAIAFAGAAALAGALRLVIFTGLAVLPGDVGAAAKRQWHMAFGLAKWALRFSKTPPRFGFSQESTDPSSPPVSSRMTP